ncbi:AfsR/SARP family transcriptional regulator [Streptacidiphilus sp. 4-A2]|nr:AfsR/SARP family transcriptional regulator [Streptacidiphilus sp. 4-A2]
MTVSTGGEPSVLAPGIPCTLLSLLLLHPNQVMSAEQLAAAVWGEKRPATASESLRNHVMRLRRLLGAEAGARVRTAAPGYLVEVREGELDSQVFVDACQRGQRALEAGAWLDAAGILSDALALWRGEPFAGLSAGPGITARIQHLRETRLLALESRIDAELALGRHQELIGEIRTLLVEHPLREGFHGQLMLALYRASRRAEALQVFQELRGSLLDELGIEPAVTLHDLQRRIIEADPGLAARCPTPAG